MVVKGQEEIIVRTAADIFGLLDRGNEKRRTASTLLNAQVDVAPSAAFRCDLTLGSAQTAPPLIVGGPAHPWRWRGRHRPQAIRLAGGN